MCKNCIRLMGRVAELEQLLGLGTFVPPPPGVTSHHWKIFGFLTKRGAASREQILTAIWPEQEQPQLRTVDANVGRLRREMRRYGIRIDAIPFFGYKIREGDLGNARLLLQGGGIGDGQLLHRNDSSWSEVVSERFDRLVDLNDVPSA